MPNAIEQVDIPEVVSGDEAGWNDVLADFEQQLGVQRRAGRQAVFRAAHEATFNVTVSAQTANVAREQILAARISLPV